MKSDLGGNKIAIFQKDKTGHRLGYIELLKKIFEAEELDIKSSRIVTIFKLAGRKEKLLFPTIDDDYFTFICVSIIRSILGCKTVGIFIRVEKCLQSKRRFDQFLKYIFFVVFKYLPRMNLVTITPHSVNKNYGKVSNFGIWDFECWDKNFIGLNVSNWKEIEELSNIDPRNKLVVVFIGSFQGIKGACEFLAILKKYPDKYIGIIAGVIPEEAVPVVSKIDNLYFVNRYITDEEVEWAYSRADIIWCRYNESYDQMSGVFGRAVQYGKKVMVRKGSLISSFCSCNLYDEELGYETIVTKSYLEPRMMQNESLDTLKGIFECGKKN